MPDSTKIEQTEDIKEKLPQIDKFKGDRTMWDEWHLGAQHKLLRDGEALGSPFDQFINIFSQLDGDAIKIVSTTARTLSENGEGKVLESVIG
ncbi:Bgt-51975 [Blumeria graminis f. sp. tritici]|uniref:Bgt-51975 n=1 Tax=Blumeria graminis f. sp. tritici TaxID=62690 RepID=A0A9X9MJ68_BLUGR|nr:Bgt-51975 [Blumeria graminis f. sp. tritici]